VSDFFLQRHIVDKAYYIAKELLMTERTYKKDLEVITVVFIYVLTTVITSKSFFIYVLTTVITSKSFLYVLSVISNSLAI
jgi:Zn-dependent peptidase ImmA (M78 family)